MAQSTLSCCFSETEWLNPDHYLTVCPKFVPYVNIARDTRKHRKGTKQSFRTSTVHWEHINKQIRPM